MFEPLTREKSLFLLDAMQSARGYCMLTIKDDEDGSTDFIGEVFISRNEWRPSETTLVLYANDGDPFYINLSKKTVKVIAYDAEMPLSV